MPLDPEGNYYADLPDPPLGGIVAAVGIQHGTGAPDVNTPISDAYIDDGSGAFYVNTTSLSTGWVLVTGGSGVAQVIPGAFDDPNGHVTPSNPLLGAVYYRDQASPVVFWGWSVSNVNWFPIIT
jgi:hypothetical protein